MPSVCAKRMSLTATEDMILNEEYKPEIEIYFISRKSKYVAGAAAKISQKYI